MKTLIIILVFFFPFIIAQDGPIVDTDWGPVMGAPFTVPDQEGTGFSFLGIPYAAPPVGDLRFAPTEDPEPWTEPLDATRLGPVCPQDVQFLMTIMEYNYNVNMSNVDLPDLTMSEECLHLNVFTSSLEGSRPVMVFIHGGALTSGGGDGYENRYMASGKDIVLVHIQYRLGPLGWLTTGDDVVGGNMAFMDQVKALHWVRDNIGNFGGNPDDITIFGESAGAMSVSLHMVSPYSAGLFNKAILQSGSSVGSNTFSPPLDLVSISYFLADMLGCPNTTSPEMVACLRTLDSDLFWKPIAPGVAVPFIPAPIVDGDYFPDLPLKLIEEGLFNKDVDIMLGNTEIEGYTFASLTYPEMHLPDFDRDKFFSEIAMASIPGAFPHLPDMWEQIAEAATEEYAADLEGDELRTAASEMVGDLFIGVWTFLTAELLAEHSERNLYFYEFNQRPSVSIQPDFINTDHYDDLTYLGCTKAGYFMYNTVDFTEDDKRMDDIMLDYWVNFARNGDPNGEGLVTWPSYRDSRSYLLLHVAPDVATDYKPERMRFWLETVPDLPKES